ncbi:MAG: prepilin peptidase [Thaumarchaeota archaeon]|nr:prepilin peptidase [Nitrososphaerota archaeon]
MLFYGVDMVYLRVSAGLVMLAIASVLDIRKREINDILWISFGAVAVVLLVVGPEPWNELRLIAVSMIIAPIALVVWRFGFFGGADAFCLIVLAGLAPMTSLQPVQVTPLTTLTNAAIISIAPFFVNLGRNLLAISGKQDIFDGFEETRLNKVVALFIGYRAKNPRHSFSMERLVGGKKRLNFGFHHAENAEFCSTMDTWVTPGIPYIIYIALGFVVQIIYGDLIFGFIRHII